MKRILIMVAALLCLYGCSTDFSDNTKVPEIVLTSAIGTGGLSISGRIQMDSSIPVGSDMQIEVDGPFNETAGGIQVNDTWAVYYRIENWEAAGEPDRSRYGRRAVGCKAWRRDQCRFHYRGAVTQQTAVRRHNPQGRVRLRRISLLRRPRCST